MNCKLKYLFVTSAVVVTALVVFEIIAHLVLYTIYNRNFDTWMIVDNKYFTSSGLKENASGMVWGKQFHTDEFGTRRNAKYDSRKKKWLFIGDSVTEGVGVEDSSTFSSLCSKEFPQFNVLNYSLIGYSTADYYHVLQSVLQKDTSVELVSLFYCLNDVYGSASPKDLPVMGKQNLIAKAASFLQDWYATYRLTKLYLYSNSNRYYQYDSQFYETDNPHFKESMNYLKQCDSICKAKNIFFQVVMLPYKSQLTDTNKNRAPQELVKEFCDTDSIAFSDATEFLVTQSAKQSGKGSLYLFADEIHFSDKGHKAIAEFLSQ